jgi:tetratricopeptide (TPR) repeat protein
MRHCFFKFVIICATLSSFLAADAPAQKPTARTFYDIGVADAAKMDYAEAIDSFQHAITLNPKYGEAYAAMGDAYFSLHRYDEAYDAYKKAVKAKPDYVKAHIALGSLANMFGDTSVAVKALKTAVKLDPENDNALFALGSLYTELEQYEEASDVYKEVIKHNPKHAEARYNLGLTYIKMGSSMLPLARKEYQILKKLDKELAEALADALNIKK